MTFVAQTPTNPNIATAATPVPAGVASAFRPNLNTYVQAVETKAEFAQACLEQLTSLLGNGAVSGGTISAGTGLSVNVAALSAIVGNIVAFDASQVVGGLVASSTNYVFLRQNGTWTLNQTGAAPTDIAAKGAFLLWGTATTGATNVTSVSNVRTPFTGAHSAPYPISTSVTGLPSTSEEIVGFITTDAFTLPAAFAGSQAKAGIAATASSVFTVAKNGTTIGTITFAASGTVGTFAAATATTFQPGDILTIVAPASADATLANIKITLRGML